MPKALLTRWVSNPPEECTGGLGEGMWSEDECHHAQSCQEQQLISHGGGKREGLRCGAMTLISVMGRRRSSFVKEEIILFREGNPEVHLRSFSLRGCQDIWIKMLGRQVGISIQSSL